MKVQRNKRYAVRKRKNYTALKVTTVLLTLLVIAAGTVFVWFLLTSDSINRTKLIARLC